jgi:hypothetical protein
MIGARPRAYRRVGRFLFCDLTVVTTTAWESGVGATDPGIRISISLCNGMSCGVDKLDLPCGTKRWGDTVLTLGPLH